MTPTLPGSIPGLLRRGSPLINRSWNPPQPDVSVECPEPYNDGDFNGVKCATDADKDGVDVTLLDLDLTDATGRAHAAWWFDSLPSLPDPKPADRASYWRALIAAHPRNVANVAEWAWCQGFGTRGEIIDALRAFRENKPVTPEQIDLLTTVARHLAGLETA